MFSGFFVFTTGRPFSLLHIATSRFIMTETPKHCRNTGRVPKQKQVSNPLDFGLLASLRVSLQVVSALFRRFPSQTRPANALKRMLRQNGVKLEG